MDFSGVSAVLEAERSETLSRIAALNQELDDIMSAGHENGDDEHDPEGATIAFERARTISLLQEARTHLSDIEDARQRVDSGTYGSCERCQADISPPRLAARPSSRTCITCASRLTR